MSLDKFQPGDPLAKPVGIFGAPFHGPVQGGTLSLPNSTTMAYQQPDTTEPDLAGTAHLVQRPGFPAVSRTTDELAADVAAGREWRNKAMLSGSRLAMYGQDLDGWIYIDSAGDRWLVRFNPALEVITLSFNVPECPLTLEFTRFGAFGKDADAVTRTTGVTNYGQGGAAFSGFQSSPGVAESITTGQLAIDGIYSDGSKVAVMIFRRRPGYIPSGQGEDVCYRHPLGWLQIAITGLGSNPTVTTTILKTREETLQVIDETEHFDTDLVSEPALAANGAAIQATVGDFNYRFECLRLLAAWPDEAASGWSFVALRYTNEGSGLGTVSTGGSSYTGTSSAEYECSMAIEVDGVPVSTIGYTSSLSSGVVVTSTGGTFPDPTWTYTSPAATSELAFLGTTYTQTTPPGYLDGNTSTTIIFNMLNYATLLSAGFDADRFCYTSTWRRELLQPTTVLVAGTANVTIDVHRYSGKCFGFRYRVQPTAGATADFVHMPRVTPSGVQGSEVGSAFSETARLYASWCPHTEVLTDLETTPICWV